ncbi:brain-enriched guanylate kinase-associated protein isoform X2 [Syngnathus acus]|uniref:brain-enriched guanylate kinase-associated protein isoform X2 n=1 Tax=Syngnathus acus TaxID=161584 RepID=UPI001886456B|nr:brain-enriched guanylate kinase-associated protein isoform X2 [Syngnathus acus]
MQTESKAMDMTRSSPCVLPQRSKFSNSAALCPVSNSDQVWLKELMGLWPKKSSSSCFVPSSSSECKGSLDSWSSKVTSRLYCSIKKKSQAAFQSRLRFRAHLPEQGGGDNCVDCPAWHHQGRGCVQTRVRTKRDQDCPLEGTLEDKAKFSHFLDEVTSNVLDPNSLRAFGKATRGAHQDQDQTVTQRIPRLSCSMAQLQDFLLELEDQSPIDLPPKTYLETDIDIVRRDDQPEDPEIKPDTPPPLLVDEQNLIPPPPNFCQGFEMKRFQESNHSSPGYPSRSISLPRGINMVCDDGMKHADNISSLLEQKEDLRKRLSYTTHKLELLQNEFDATRQYLETELRRAQEELDKFTDKLRRIQSSYSALQRINQDLEEKIHRDSQHHDDEKRALSREIIVLNNHLMEAKLTIDKLQGDNDVYRKDCNLAAQLLQCNKSLYRAQLSEERLTMHMEETPLCRTYSDSMSASLIGQVLEKPDELCSSSQASRSASPRTPDHAFVLEPLGQREQLGLRAAYKSDLYSSDTALYCPDDRHRERRPSMDLHGQRKLLFEPQNSTDSNPEECSVGLRAAFTQDLFAEFPPLGAGSSSYSSFSGGGSEDKANGPLSSAASSPRHRTLYMDWRDAGDYERKSDSSWERDSPGGFGNNHPFQQTEMIHQQNSSSPVYSRTMSSCFSEPYEPLPPSSSPSVAYGDSRRGSTLAPEEEELIGRWRQLSAEDLSSHSYRSPGRASPYSFSEQHFSVRPAKIRLGPLYSSFQEGADYYHQQGAGSVQDPMWVAASPECSPVLRQAHSQAHVYEDSKGSEHSLYHSGDSKDLEGNEASGGQSVDYGDQSPNSSTESLHRRSLEMTADLQHYQVEMHNLSAQVSPSSPPPAPPPPPLYHQKVGSLGLSRKDSLTKAQLYGTLLN